MLKRCLLFLVCAISLASALNCTTYAYKQVSDLKIQLAVCTPDTHVPRGGFPVLFAAHGGGYFQGSYQTGMSGQELSEALKRGWTVVSIDYRLLPSVSLDEIFSDVQDAYQWVRTQLPMFTPINPDLIIVFGQSAGGGIAILTGYKLSPRPKAILAFYAGFSNWTDPFVYDPTTPVNPAFAAAANKFSVPVMTEYIPVSQTDPKFVFWMGVFSSHKLGWLMTTHDPNLPNDQIIAKLRELSAVEHVDKNYPPTYLAHGLVDTIVPYTQSVQLANKLKENKVDYVIDLVPNADHGFDYDATYWQQHVLPAFEFAQKYVSDEKTIPRTSFLQKLRK